MTLFLIGLGLGSLDDVTLRGDKALRECTKIFIDAYTSVMPNLDEAAVSARYPHAEVVMADRDLIESGSAEIIEAGRDSNAAFAVIGDVFAATTHSTMIAEAKARGILLEVIHNASIMNAVGQTGLHLYNFGVTVSIPYFEGEWRPRSYVDKALVNYHNGMHTLMLLDIKVRERTVENIVKNRKIYEPQRFMSIAEALDQLEALGLFSELGDDVLLVGVARMGTPTQFICAGTHTTLRKVDFGGPLHSLILPGPEIDVIERETLSKFDFTR